ncbi:hypothetical protein ZWY2020_049505 [Hordeum vulgare]|nr:hypothetical protein ZWY2020_049505 [Hordeum vulgare]
MAPKKTSKGKSGFFGATAKPFGNFGVEFFDAARRWWLDMYPTADEAARAYDVALWNAERPKAFLNFSEIETRLGSWLVPQGIRMAEMPMMKKKKRSTVVVTPDESDEAAMARFAREHLKYVQAEREFY